MANAYPAYRVNSALTDMVLNKQYLPLFTIFLLSAVCIIINSINTLSTCING